MTFLSKNRAVLETTDHVREMLVSDEGDVEDIVDRMSLDLAERVSGGFKRAFDTTLSGFEVNLLDETGEFELKRDLGRVLDELDLYEKKSPRDPVARFFYVIDDMTEIPVMVTFPHLSDGEASKVLRRGGYGVNSDFFNTVIVTHLGSTPKTEHDPYSWGNNGTMLAFHLMIQEGIIDLSKAPDGMVIDVRDYRRGLMLKKEGSK